MAACLLLLLVGGGGLMAVPARAQTTDASGNATLADCGPGSAPEAGLQGWVPPSDPSYVTQGYRCNLELVGQLKEMVGQTQLDAYEDCLYVGNEVFDISDPARPIRTAVLDTPGITGSVEAGKVNVRRGLLAGGQAGVRAPPHPAVFDGPVPIVFGGPWFDVYDLKPDCKHPTLLSSTKIYEGASPHSGGFSPDGTVYYSTGAAIGSMFAIDVSDPTKPKKFYEWTENNLRSSTGRNVAPHLVDFAPGDDGDIALLPDMDNGLIIADISQIRSRKPGMQVKILSDTRWGDPSELGAGTFLGGYEPMSARVGRINGRNYAFVNDEAGPRQTPAQACEEGLPPYGFVHVIDVTEPAAPEHVSTIRLEVADPANCSETAFEPGQRSNIAYSPHYCKPDDPERTTALACSWTQGGVRVFDVRDPLQAREIAYYNPRPRPEESPQGAGKAIFTPNPLREGTSSDIVWRTDQDGRTHLWFSSAYNGLQSLTFTNDAYPLNPQEDVGEPAAGPVDCDEEMARLRPPHCDDGRPIQPSEPAAGRVPTSAPAADPTSSSSPASVLPATGGGLGLALVPLLLAVVLKRRRDPLQATPPPS